MNNYVSGDLSKISDAAANFFSGGYLVLVLVSLGTLTATFSISGLTLDFQTKTLFFSVITLSYILFYLLFHIRQKNKFQETKKVTADALYSKETEYKLSALEDAGTFFGTSLKFSDMFRLAASRINELVPFAACVLFLVEDSKTGLRIASSVGDNTRNLPGLTIGLHKGLAGRALLERKIEHEENNFSDSDVLPESFLENVSSGLAIPLFRGDEIFAILNLYGDGEKKFDQHSVVISEAVAVRVSPLLAGSLSFERSLTNALTDTLTSLPNERAFYLVLEDQIAESYRKRGEWNLTVLTIDIQNFAELNQDFGYSAGDRVLNFAANLIKAQLRQMDFLARSINDEFLAVLPTASDETAMEIVGRLEKAFFYNRFEISARKKVNIRLNFGTANFGKDGETAHQLLQKARLKKRQAKSTHPADANVLCFPKQYTK